jgi:hypothetical protein
MFSVSFHVNDKLLGEVLAAIHRFKILDLDLRPVVVKGAKGKAGGARAWEAIAAAATAIPKQPREFRQSLLDAGFGIAGISTHIASAVKYGAIKKTAKGYVKTGEKK